MPKKSPITAHFTALFFGEKMGRKQPNLTVDTIIVHKDKILMVKRKNDPFKDWWALPGGFVEYGEEPHLSAVRETKEETNLDITIINKNQPFVYGKSDRDPRGHTITMVFVGKIDDDTIPRAGDDAAQAEFLNIDEINDISIAFDHISIIREVLIKTFQFSWVV